VDRNRRSNIKDMISTHINGQFAGNYTSIDKVPSNKEIAPIQKPDEFTKGFWNGSEWIETATIEEIDTALIINYEENIIEKYKYLMLRALSSSMGKYGSYEYLQIQKSEYEDKYKVAKGLVSNTSIETAIEKEMIRDFSEPNLEYILNSYGIAPIGSHLNKMYQLIVFRYEYAENRYNTFKGFIIDFRTKCRTLVESKEWSKLDNAFVLVDNLPNELTDVEIQNFYTNFENI
jgi:hypothetical protein